MSEDLNYQFVKIPNSLFYADITPARFRLISFLIARQRVNDETGLIACYLGYECLADYMGTSKGAVIKEIKILQALGVVEVLEKAYTTKDSHQKVNGLRVVFSAIGGLPKRELKRNRKKAQKGSLKDSSLVSKGSLNETSKGSLNETSYLNLNTLDLNNYEGSLNETSCNSDKSELQRSLADARSRLLSGEKNIATGDVAPFRSIANNESAINGVAETQGELEDSIIAEKLKENFNDILPVITLIRAKNRYAIRPFLARSVSDLRKCDLYEFFKKEGKKFDFLKKNEHLQGEIIINL